MHYTRWRNYGDPLYTKRVQRYSPDATCSVDGCEMRPKTRGWCELHYDRWRATGDPLAVLVDARPAEQRWRDSYEITDLGYVTPCWLWTGKVGVHGYGRIRNRRTTNGITDPLAHRFAYEQVVGPIPEGMTLDHLCHNADEACNSGTDCPHRRCVNPDHLEPVTGQANVFRGRTPAAINKAKTHCLHGHEFTPDNTRIIAGGKRQCVQCGARRQREFRARRARRKE